MASYGVFWLSGDVAYLKACKSVQRGWGSTVLSSKHQTPIQDLATRGSVVL